MQPGRSTLRAQKRADVLNRIKPGAIALLHCPFTLPPKIKYLVFLYVDKDSNENLVFLINSELPEFIKHDGHLKEGQLELSNKVYGFFPNEISYLDCTQTHDELDLQEAITYLMSNPDDFKGELTPGDINTMIEYVRKSQTLMKIDKEIIIKAFDC